MRIADSRRLTGGNLQSANPCAVAEVRFTSGDDVERLLARWREELARCAPSSGSTSVNPSFEPIKAERASASTRPSMRSTPPQRSTKRRSTERLKTLSAPTIGCLSACVARS